MFFRCYFIRRKLINYYEGSLTPDKKLAVELHLSKCPACMGHAYTLKKTQQLVSELEDHHRPPDEYWETIWARLRQRLFDKK